MQKDSNYIKFDFHPLEKDEVIARSEAYKMQMKKRRSIRHFSDRPIPYQVIQNIIETAASAPSGANKQPWHFVAVQDKDIKYHIRKAAEHEEFINYNGRMPERWLEDLAPLGTDWSKPFLEDAPWLIIVFKRSYDISEDGNSTKN